MKLIDHLLVAIFCALQHSHGIPLAQSVGQYDDLFLGPHPSESAPLDYKQTNKPSTRGDRKKYSENLLDRLETLREKEDNLENNADNREFHPKTVPMFRAAVTDKPYDAKKADAKVDPKKKQKLSFDLGSFSSQIPPGPTNLALPQQVPIPPVPYPQPCFGCTPNSYSPTPNPQPIPPIPYPYPYPYPYIQPCYQPHCLPPVAPPPCYEPYCLPPVAPPSCYEPHCLPPVTPPSCYEPYCLPPVPPPCYAPYCLPQPALVPPIPYYYGGSSTHLNYLQSMYQSLKYSQNTNYPNPYLAPMPMRSSPFPVSIPPPLPVPPRPFPVPSPGPFPYPYGGSSSHLEYIWKIMEQLKYSQDNYYSNPYLGPIPQSTPVPWVRDPYAYGGGSSSNFDYYSSKLNQMSYDTNNWYVPPPPSPCTHHPRCPQYCPHHCSIGSPQLCGIYCRPQNPVFY